MSSMGHVNARNKLQVSQQFELFCLCAANLVRRTMATRIFAGQDLTPPGPASAPAGHLHRCHQQHSQRQASPFALCPAAGRPPSPPLLARSRAPPPALLAQPQRWLHTQGRNWGGGCHPPQPAGDKQAGCMRLVRVHASSCCSA